MYFESSKRELNTMTYNHIAIKTKLSDISIALQHLCRQLPHLFEHNQKFLLGGLSFELHYNSSQYL